MRRAGTAATPRLCGTSTSKLVWCTPVPRRPMAGSQRQRATGPRPPDWAGARSSSPEETAVISGVADTQAQARCRRFWVSQQPSAELPRSLLALQHILPRPVMFQAVPGEPTAASPLLNKRVRRSGAVELRAAALAPLGQLPRHALAFPTRWVLRFQCYGKFWKKDKAVLDGMTKAQLSSVPWLLSAPIFPSSSVCLVRAVERQWTHPCHGAGHPCGQLLAFHGAM